MVRKITVYRATVCDESQPEGNRASYFPTLKSAVAWTEEYSDPDDAYESDIRELEIELNKRGVMQALWQCDIQT